MSIPADAGPVLRDLRKRSRVTNVIVIGLAVMLLVIVAGTPSAWPVLVVFAGTSLVSWLLYKLRKRAIAVCEHGLVVARAGRATLVSWDRVKHVRVIHGRYITCVVDYDDTNCLLTDRAAGGLIEQRVRARSA